MATLFDGEKIIEFHDLTDILLKKSGIKVSIYHHLEKLMMVSYC